MKKSDDVKIYDKAHVVATRIKTAHSETEPAQIGKE